jgi:hypothetical protein
LLRLAAPTTTHPPATRAPPSSAGGELATLPRNFSLSDLALEHLHGEVGATRWPGRGAAGNPVCCRYDLLLLGRAVAACSPGPCHAGPSLNKRAVRLAWLLHAACLAPARPST